MRILPAIAVMMMSPLLHAVEWSIEQCSSLDLLAGRTGIADVRPSNDPHQNFTQMMEQNSGIYRGQWSWQSEMPELLYEILHTGEATKVSPSGFTALQAACVYADENLFSALIAAGVPVDARPGDWAQLGYVGDTPLGLLVRFMNSRSAVARVRMARVLLERGANPDAPMTTWRGNRVVSSVPFCELGKQDFNHEMRQLLLSYGDKNLAVRTAGWQLDWDWYRPELVQHLRRNGVARKGEVQGGQDSAPVLKGEVPLLDLIRKGDVEGVRLALESGASIEISPRARRYGQEPLFNIPARRADDPEAAVEIARMLVDAGADVNDLNRHGRSLRIYYDRFYSKASRALCAYFKSQGALIHPDSPSYRSLVEKSHQEARERAAAFAARIAAAQQPAAEEPAPVVAEQEPQPQQPAAEEPAPVVAEQEPQPQQPAAEEPAPVVAEQEPQPQQPAAEEPAPAVAEQEPQPQQPAVEEPASAVAEQEPQPQQPAAEEPAPAVAEQEPQPQQPVVEEPAPAVAEQEPLPQQPVVEEPAPAVAEQEPQPQQPAVEEPAPAVAEQEPQPQQPAAEEPAQESASDAARKEHMKRLMQEVQAQLAELQAKLEAEQNQAETNSTHDSTP